MSNERETDIELSTAEVIPRLPAYFQPNQQSILPDDFEGAVIVRLGTIDAGQKVEGGGLVIDYRKPDSNQVRRVVFAFNELGMWLEHSCSLESSATLV